MVKLVCILIWHLNPNILLLYYYKEKEQIYMGSGRVEGVWALTLVRKFRQCPCCHGQGPVVKIVHCDHMVKKSVTEEVTMMW